MSNYDRLCEDLRRHYAGVEEVKKALADLGYATLEDAGSLVYLDGASMQFSVSTADGSALAYFEDGGDAQLFVDAYNRKIDQRQRGRTKVDL